MVRALVIASLLAMSGAAAQSVPVTRLAPANGTLDAEFITITAARELSDGRVLVSDPRDRRLVVGDFRTGAVRQVGRTGSGPGEYSTALPAVPIGGDSSLMIDGLARRWLVLVRDSIVGTIPPDARVVQEVRTHWGASRRGQLLSTKPPPLDPRGEPINPKDSLSLVFVARQTGRVDTIGKLWMGPPRPATGVRVFSHYDMPLLTIDGWVAVIRHDPFRVDWRSPEGKWTLGGEIRVPVERVTEADKEAYIKRLPPVMLAEISSTRWPSVMPAVPPQKLLATADGHLVAMRYASVAHPNPTYYVMDRQGKLIRQVELAPGEQIVSFGQSSVFVSFKDADDIVRLRRHSWP